jgi:hypothetical protein
MADPKNTESNDGGRLERAGANATAQGKNQSSGTATVTVGCKLPHGLMLDITEEGKAGRRFRIKGSNSAGIIGGFGLTPGVPKDLWDAWHKKHEQLEFVRNGLVFAYDKTGDASARAKEVGGDLSSGLDPIDPNKKRNKIETLKTEDTVAA